MRWIEKTILIVLFLLIFSFVIYLIDKRIGAALFAVLWLCWKVFLQLFIKDVANEVAVYILLALLLNGSVFYVSRKKEKYYFTLASCIVSVIGCFVLFI